MEKTNKGKTIITWLFSIGISIGVIYAVLISSFELAAYGNFDFYEEEYEKYRVTEWVNMEMDDVMYVTTEMMSYLRGDREDLNIDTIIGGEEKEFFNESEISHMEDVRDMFIGGINGRRICIIVSVILLLIMLALKVNWKQVLPRAFRYTTVVFVVVVGILGGLFAVNFDKYFEIFHRIFFEGDTWIFDPATSYMIRMLPEGLFYDMTIRIVAIFLGIMVALFVLASVVIRKQSRKKI